MMYPLEAPSNLTNIIQTHKTLLSVLEEMSKFPKIPNLSDGLLGNLSVKMIWRHVLMKQCSHNIREEGGARAGSKFFG